MRAFDILRKRLKYKKGEVGNVDAAHGVESAVRAGRASSADPTAAGTDERTGARAVGGAPASVAPAGDAPAAADPAGDAPELAVPVPEQYAGFDPTRPFPVFITGAFHAGVVRELNACTDAADVMALFAHSKRAGCPAPYELLRERLAKVRGGEKGVGDYAPATCRKFLRSLRELNPLIEDLWHDADRAPAARVFAPAFVRAVARHAVAVDISQRALSDAGLRLYLGSLALSRAATGKSAVPAAPPEDASHAAAVPAALADDLPTAAAEGMAAGISMVADGANPGIDQAAADDASPAVPAVRIHIADIVAASQAHLFAGRGSDAFAERDKRGGVRAAWRTAGFIDGAPAPDPLTRDGRTVTFAVKNPAAFPALVRADALLFPPAEAARHAGPFTGAVLAARRAAALAMPRRLLVPATARDAVRDAPCFRLARAHDLLGRVAVFEQMIGGKWQEVALAVRHVVENEYRGLFVLGVRLNNPSGRLSLWSAPARADILRWKHAGRRLADLPCQAELARLFGVIDARLGVACAAVTDVPLAVTLVLRGDAVDQARDRRVAEARARQVRAVRAICAAAGPVLGAAAAGALMDTSVARADAGPHASASSVRAPYEPAGLVVRRHGLPEGCYEYHDVVSGRTEFLAELRARADAVVDVSARYVVRDQDPEQQLAKVPYQYVWAWDGKELMGLGGSAVGVLKAYERWAAVHKEQVPGGLPAGVERVVHREGEPEEWLELRMDDGTALTVPLAASVRRYRERQRQQKGDGHER